LDAGYRSNDLFQALSSLHDGLASEVVAVAPKQIEQEIDNWSSRTFLPFLQQLKARYAFLI
jgi:type VI protein secretion system component VasK